MQLENIISNLKTMLPAQDFILTGSFVLAKYGLRSWNSVQDLDIILVKPEVSAIELINRYMTDFPAPSTAKCKALSIPEEEAIDLSEIKKKKYNPDFDDEEDDEPIKPKSKFKATVSKVAKSTTLSIFMFDNVKIDIYIENDFNETTLTVELENHMACKFTTIPHIIKAKRSYGRMKDWLQCRDMSLLIFDSFEFDQKLNNWKDMLREDY